MKRPEPGLCARCGHPAEDHTPAICRQCWEQEQRWVRVLMTAPTHTYADPSDPAEVERAAIENQAATKRTLHHLLGDPDRRFRGEGAV